MVLALSLSFISCATVAPQVEVANADFSAPLFFDNAKAEQEGLFTLAVYKDWQTKETISKQGHNIGSIRVNEKNDSTTNAKLY